MTKVQGWEFERVLRIKQHGTEADGVGGICSPLMDLRGFLASFGVFEPSMLEYCVNITMARKK